MVAGQNWLKVVRCDRPLYSYKGAALASKIRYRGDRFLQEPIVRGDDDRQNRYLFRLQFANKEVRLLLPWCLGTCTQFAKIFINY